MLETTAEKRQRRISAFFAILLWVVTAVFGVLNIVFIRLVVLRTYLRFVPDGQGALSLLNILILFSAAIVFVAAVIGGAEYHRTRYGTRQSWEWFARVLALETAVMLLPLFL